MSHPVGTSSRTFTTPALTVGTSYWVDVSCDVCGTGASDTATVSICSYPPVVTGPGDQSIRLGQAAHIVLGTLSGSGWTFFWYQGPSGDTSHPLGDYLGDWGPYNYLDVSPAVTTQYWAQVRNGTCVSSTTTTTVSVCIPTITTQPAGVMINSGQTTTLTVVANTPGLTYRWYSGNSGDTSSPISGATGASYAATPAATTSYWVRVTGSCGQFANSNTATVTVCTPPAITTQPQGTSIVQGQATTLGVIAGGTNLTYQWYQGASGNTATPVGSTSPSLGSVSPNAPVDYWVKVSGSCGSVNSAAAHISVCSTPSVATPPQNVSVFSGSSATLGVTASEATGEPMHYQWHRGISGPVNVGTDSATYNTGALSASASYYVTVTAGVCAADSAAATVSICPLPATVSGPANVNSSPGQTVRLQFGALSGATGYAWYRGNSGDVSFPLSGGFQVNNYFDVSPSVTTSYWARVQNGSCVSSSTTTTVNVCMPVITQQPGSVTIPSGSTTLPVVSNLPGSTYQWYVGPSGTTSSPIPGATAASVTVSPASTTNYWCRVSGSCGTANSNTATVTICSTPAITQQPANSNSYPYYANGLSVTATGTSLTYQWYMGASGDTSAPMGGSTSNTLSLNPGTSTRYWVRVTGMCGTVNSSAAWMSVYPTITQQPQPTTYLAQGSRATLTVAAGGTGLHYQWFNAATGPVAGAPDSASFITPDINSTNTGFFCQVTSAGGAMTQTQSGGFSFCDGRYLSATTVTNYAGNCRLLTANINGGYDQIYWYQGQRGDTSTQVSSGSNTFYVCPPASTTYWYRVVDTDPSLQVTCYTDSAAVTVP